jgi:thymidylate synthase ThyX
MIQAKVIADSINSNGNRLITFQTRSPKFIDSEMGRHRMLSQNSSSDRAIPFARMLDKEYYLPFDVRKNQKGMQGYEKINDEDATEFRYDADEIYSYIVNKMIPWSGKVHKQHINRYLLPFAMQDKVISGTDWDNFFNLRLAPDAQPEIQTLARRMKEAMNESTPVLLESGQWHLPYVDISADTHMTMEEAIKCSVARCARVSYGNHDGSKADIQKDLELYEFLVSSRHLSPLEHQATPMSDFELGQTNDINPRTWENGVTHLTREWELYSGNLNNWIQFRQTV